MTSTELYRLGQGVKQNNLKAESYYLEAARNNHVLAQLNLARLYYFGALGFEQTEKAFYWANKAAKQNNADAQWMLGGMLFNGDGVAQDSVAAYSWLALASEQNHLQAALNLAKVKPHLTLEQHDLADQLTAAFKANNNAKDDIIEQEKEAFYWFHKAAQQNDAQAQWLVAKMYLEGQGVKQDKIAAYSWLTLASEQNQPGASLKLAQLKGELTEQQISLADSLTATFKQQGSPLLQEPQAKPAVPQQQLTKGPCFRVQVGLFTSRLDVDIELAKLNRRFPKIMTEYKLTITDPDPTSPNPDYYRIQIGAFDDKTEAKKLCENLSKHKQACFVVKVADDN